jgi:hypothetical protein
LLLDLGLLSVTSVPKNKQILEKPRTQSPIPFQSDSQSQPADSQQTQQTQTTNTTTEQSNNEEQNEAQKSGLGLSQEIQTTGAEFYDEFRLSMSNIQLVLRNKVRKEK